MVKGDVEASNVNTSKGFTLIEMMVVVAIIAILAQIAVPAYSDYMQRGRIAEAFGQLAAQRSKLEQYFLDNRTYVGACAAGTVAPLPTGKYFTYSCPTLTDTTFTIQANGQNGADAFTFTVNQANVQATTAAPSGWGTSATCWVTKKGESC